MNCSTCTIKSCECNCNTQCNDYALLVLRIALAIIFITHGYGKLFGHQPGMDVFAGMIRQLGFPLPTLFAFAAAISEFVGGIALLLGVWTKLFSILIAIVMFVAFAMVHRFSLPAGDAALALLAMSMSLALSGPGMLSIAGRWFEHKEAQKPKPSRS